MGEVGHHDSSRSKVGQTAFGVAILRAEETRRGAVGGALIEDPFAQLFRDEASDAWWASFLGDAGKAASMQTGIAVRSRRIDDEVLAALRAGVAQVVVVGAGLDCRPWRLKCPEEARAAWYEVDFPEVFDYKLGVLRTAGGGALPPSSVDYRPVPCNVAAEKTTDKLLAAGYDPKLPAIWVLEGFTGYLTEDELREAMAGFTAHCAAGARLVATFLGEHYTPVTSMHRFLTDKPMEFLSTWGWKGEAEVLGDACSRLGRSPDGWTDYYLVTARL